MLDEEPIFPGNTSAFFVELLPRWWFGKSINDTHNTVYRQYIYNIKASELQIMVWKKETMEKQIVFNEGIFLWWTKLKHDLNIWKACILLSSYFQYCTGDKHIRTPGFFYLLHLFVAYCENIPEQKCSRKSIIAYIINLIACIC